MRKLNLNYLSVIVISVFLLFIFFILFVFIKKTRHNTKGKKIILLCNDTNKSNNQSTLTNNKFYPIILNSDDTTRKVKVNTAQKNLTDSKNITTLKNLFNFKNNVKEKKWEYIVLHHSATKGGSAKAFDDYHRNYFGDPNGLEYHFVVDNNIGKVSADGLIEEGNRWERQILANHLFRPNLAYISIAICFVGNFNTDQRVTTKQYKNGIKLIKRLKDRYQIKNKKIIQHADIDTYERYLKDGISSTSCPGKYFPYDKIIKDLEKEE